MCIIVIMNAMHSELPPLSDLVAIRTLWAEGSVSKAADKLGMTQSALSHALERMRQRFKDPLFVRTGNRMAPTPFAERLHGPTLRILRILEDEIPALNAFDPATTEREFRIASSEIGAITLIPRLVRALTRKAPRAKLTPVQLPPGAIATALNTGQVDVYAGYLPESAPGLKQQLLYRRTYVCVARKDHPTVGEQLSFAQFASTRQILTPAIASAAKEIDRALRGKGLRAAPATVCPYVAAVPFIVSASDNIALIPEEVFELFRPITRLKRVRLPVRIPRLDIRQYWDPRVTADPAISFLRDLIFETGHEP